LSVEVCTPASETGRQRYQQRQPVSNRRAQAPTKNKHQE